MTRVWGVLTALSGVFVLAISVSTLVLAAPGGDTPARSGQVAGVQSGPSINVWYGSPQKFGQMGVPQRRINILGNVSSASGMFSLSYTLNGGPSIPLLWGPDTRRLSRAGDFNIDIPVENLNPGPNSVLITATDNTSASSTQGVNVVWTNGRVWPAAYTLYWRSPSTLSDSVQVVDGLWWNDGGGVRPQEMGYDRIIAIGDSSRSDYEIQARIYVHTIDNSDTAFDGTNGGPAVGFLIRWNGHTDQPAFVPPITQPLSGYLPYGAIGWYHYRAHNGNGLTDRWELMGNNLNILGTSQQTPLPVGTLFNVKMRVKTVSGQGTYSFKAWENGTTEPSSWMLTGLGAVSDPSHGSILLLAHRVDASYSDILVSPLGPLTAPVLAAPSNGSTGVFGGSVLSWNSVTNAGSYDVQVSTSSNFTSGMQVDQTGIRDLSFVLPALPGSTTYYWRVRAENPEGVGSYSSVWSFTTTLQPPTIVSPVANVLNTPIPATLIWNRVNGSTYGLQVGTDSTFSGGVVVNESGIVDTFRVVAGLQYSTRYFWRANATFGSTTSAYSSVGSFTTTLPSPLLASPADGAANLSAPISCTWRSVPSATSYRIQVATDPAFVNGILVDDAAVVDTTRALSGVQPSTRYYWRVSAKNAAGSGGFSTARSFVTTLPVAVLLSPANGSAGFVGSIVLRWGAISQAQTYHLQASPDPLFSSNFIVNDSTLVDTSRSVTGLANNTTYYWRVRGKNANGGGPFSAGWTFSTLISAPSQLLPSNGSVGQPVSVAFLWNKVPSAVTYQIILATDSTFLTGIVKNDSTIVDTTRTVNGLQNGVHYYWRVRAKNAQGTGAYSPAWGFRTIGVSPSQVVPLIPAMDSATKGDSAMFVWQRSTPSVTRYWFELGVDSLFSLRSIDSTVVDTTKVVSGLGSQTYWWKVRAFNAEGWGLFSNVQRFTNLVTGVDREPLLATGFSLEQNYPNPFNPSTVIEFVLGKSSQTRLDVFSPLGQTVATLVDGPLSAGRHSVVFNARDLSSGIYFYRLRAGEVLLTRKMLLMK